MSDEVFSLSRRGQLLCNLGKVLNSFTQTNPEGRTVTHRRLWLSLAVTFSILLALTPVTPQVKATVSAEYVNDSGYFDSSVETYYVLGEVQNTGNVNLGFVEVKATFYDWLNTVVGTESGYTSGWHSLILPGRKAPFWIPFDNPQAAKVHHHALTLDFQETDENPPLNLEILSLSSYEWNGDSAMVHIVGKMRNNGPARTTSINVFTTCYGSNGRVAAIDEAVTEDLDPAQNVDFEIQVDHPRVSRSVGTSCELFAESDDYISVAQTLTQAGVAPATSTIPGTSTSSAETGITVAAPTTRTSDFGYFIVGLAVLMLPVVVIVLVVLYVRARHRRGVTSQAAASTAPENHPSPSREERGVKYCVDCGAEIPSAVQYCTKCGHKQ
jgi:hypothetical protein